jgi:DNA polymerase III, gamma/tau subunits
MRFSDIIGNEELKGILTSMVDRDRLPHAILLTEGGAWGAIAFAIALSQYVNCEDRSGGDSCGVCNSCHKIGKLIHPDLHFAFPVNASNDLSDSEKKAPISDYFLKSWRELVLENPYFTEQDLYDVIGIDKKSGNISVHEAKRIFEKLSLRAFESDWKTMIIWLPEKMNSEASNKLLKLLEEPPQGTLFILVSHAPEKLLSTIRSRCQMISLKPLSRSEQAQSNTAPEVNPEFQEIICSMLEAGLAKKLSDTLPIWEMLSDFGREKQKDFCIYAENFIRKIYMVASSLEEIADVAEEERDIILSLASRIKPSFYEKGFSVFEKAIPAIEGNVNSKLVFCDLCNRILIYL